MCVLTSIWLGRLPHIAPAPARESGEPRIAVLPDLPFVVITVLSGVTATHFIVMELAMPLWISQYTSAPRSLVATTLMINTVCVALLQVRLTRGIDLVVSSSRAMARSGLWIAGGSRSSPSPAVSRPGSRSPFCVPELSCMWSAR